MTLPALFLLAAAAFTIGMAVITIRSPRAPGRYAFALAGLSAAWWIVAVIFRLNTSDLNLKIFLSEIAWYGIVATPLFWSAGFLRYAKFGSFNKGRYLRWILIFSLTVCIGALTNDWHHGFYTGVINAQRPTFSHGWLYFLLMAFLYSYMALSCIVALRLLKNVSSLHRWQLVAIIAAMALPWAANIAHNAFGFRVFNDDPTPFAFGITSLVMLVGHMRFKIFEAPPIARDVIFAILPDPVIVLDKNRRILELNPAAQALPGMATQPVGSILPAGHPLAQKLQDGSGEQGKCDLLRFESEAKIYEISCQPLEQWGRTDCQMLVLRNITARESAREQLAAATRDLELRLAENMQLQKQLQDEASRDHLTGLYNRRHANATVPAILKDTAKGSETAIIIIDIDHFKLVNDRFGHDAGDKVLKAFAAILKRDLDDEPGMVFRYGGEEFMIVLPGLSRDTAIARCQAWREKLADIRLKAAPGVAITFSAGIAFSPKAGNTLDACAKAADIALYQAKISGRNRDIVWGEDLKNLSPRNLRGLQSKATANEKPSRVA